MDMLANFLENSSIHAHLSPGVPFIYDLAHDSGILQSGLFTSGVGVRIWFHPNCQVGVFGDIANFSSEIG